MKTNIGKWLKELRLKAGLSQGDVAQKLGYTSPQFVSNWERDLSVPPKATLPEIAKIYKTDLKQIKNTFLEIKIEELKQEWA